MGKLRRVAEKLGIRDGRRGSKQRDARVDVLSSAQGMAVSITHATQAAPCSDRRAFNGRPLEVANKANEVLPQ